MFWQYNTNCSSSQIESLLAKEDVTLKEVMDSDDIINECKVQNKALMDFFQKPNIMEELVALTVNEPPQDMDERERFKYSNIACEILTCDVPALNERLAGDDALLEKLYSFLNNEPPLNPLLASFFSKIMGALIAKKTEQNWLSYQFTCLQVLDFLKAKETFISFLLKHLGTSAIMDLMLKLFTQVEGVEMKQNILNWLDSQRVIQSLVNLMNASEHKNIHNNVAQLLRDFIRISRENKCNSIKNVDSDPLLKTLESTETVTLLLNNFLTKDKCESAIAGGIQILLSLLDLDGLNDYGPSTNIYNSNDDFWIFQLEGKTQILNNIVNAILPRLDSFHDLLLNPPLKSPLETTIGTLDPPLGYTRLQIIKLYVLILSMNNKEFLEHIIKLGTFEVFLDLFLKYPWNNFLHTQVERCLISTITVYGQHKNDTAVALYKNLLEDCKLLDKILNAWEENDEKQKSNGVRQGYMGHLIEMLSEIVNLSNTTYFGVYLKECLPHELQRLEEFKDKTLSKVNEIQDSWLGGVQPKASNNNEIDFTEVPFTQSSTLQQQVFTEYQLLPSASQNIDDMYGSFSDEVFYEVDDASQSLDPRTDINFDLWEGHQKEDKKQETFKLICGRSLNTLDDTDDQVFDDVEHTLQTVIEKQGGRCSLISNSDSEEDLIDETNKDMDADEFNLTMELIRSAEKENPSKNDAVHEEEKAKTDLITTELLSEMLKTISSEDSKENEQIKENVKKDMLPFSSEEKEPEKAVDSSCENSSLPLNESVESAAGDVEVKVFNEEVQPSKNLTTVVGDCSEKKLETSNNIDSEGKEYISECK